MEVEVLCQNLFIRVSALKEAKFQLRQCCLAKGRALA